MTTSFYPSLMIAWSTSHPLSRCGNVQDILVQFKQYNNILMTQILRVRSHQLIRFPAIKTDNNSPDLKPKMTRPNLPVNRLKRTGCNMEYFPTFKIAKTKAKSKIQYTVKQPIKQSRLQDVTDRAHRKVFSIVGNSHTKPFQNKLRNKLYQKEKLITESHQQQRKLDLDESCIQLKDKRSLMEVRSLKPIEFIRSLVLPLRRRHLNGNNQTMQIQYLLSQLEKQS